ncbi:hypothetical protein [Polyangium sp. y55x31]|uniref:hypothetical protein n=1 Tax=Polyangium sp. y55x31 TaxID=3042688 RepID=UPI0024830B9A|nr:hypothetical protein [Polyangium sp. y55x31]MDI1476501.1 hypothetical protein [Polyangium sp. y55x31]
MNTKTTLLAFSCLCALGSLSGFARAERFIDTFAAPLPQQTLPGTTSPSPTLWVGTLGGSSQPDDVASQSGLAGVLGGARDTTLMASTMSNSVTLSSTTNGGRYALGYAAGTGSSGHLLLEYGAAADLNANLSGDGSVAFELEIVGDMDNSIPTRPVQLTVTVASGAVQAFSTITVVNDGVYQIPFSNFPGVNFADVDYVSFDFDGAPVSAIDYDLIGGIRTTACLQPSGSAVADIMLDTFGAPFPSRAWPGVGTYPILWAGKLNGTLKPTDTASQAGLFGVIAGQRDAVLSTSSQTTFINAGMSSLDATPTLSYATPSSTSGILKLIYGNQSNLNANLSRAKAFELEIQGDMNDSVPYRPVPLTVTVLSGAVTRSATVTLLNDGMVYIPFTSFPQVNWNDVDRVTFSFDSSQVQAVDYTLIGGLRASACIP